MASEQAISCEVCSAQEGFIEDVTLTLEGEYGPEEVGITYDNDGVAHYTGLALFDDNWYLTGRKSDR